MPVEDVAVGLLAGAGYGVVGYFKNRSESADEKFKPKKFASTVVLTGLAGGAVGYMGQPLNGASIESMVSVLASVGVAETVNKGVKTAFRTVKNLKGKYMK